jgi:multidrug efflux pump subunit AcrA (membrane-fusion protein)
MKTKKTFSTTAIILGAVFAAAGLIFVPSLIGDDRKKAPVEDEAPLLSVKTAAAERRTLRAFLEVNGDVVSKQQADVYPDMPGKLVRLNVALGSRVKKGDVIALVDPSKPGMTYMNSPVYAPISGIVSETPLSLGTTVSQSQSITSISLMDDVEISARIPEREIAGLAAGLEADVTLQAYPGEVFGANVSHVSPVIDSASRTKLITLTFDENDSRINAGMFVRVRLNTRSYDDVITVPAEALINRHGENHVYVLQNGEAGEARVEQRTVVAGVTLEGRTEIISGLAAGEAVVVQGQQLLSGGETVRVIGGTQQNAAGAANGAAPQNAAGAAASNGAAE